MTRGTKCIPKNKSRVVEVKVIMQLVPHDRTFPDSVSDVTSVSEFFTEVAVFDTSSETFYHFSLFLLPFLTSALNFSFIRVLVSYYTSKIDRGRKGGDGRERTV